MGVLGAVLADEPAAPRRAGPLAGLLLRLLLKDPAARPTAVRARRELAAVAGIADVTEDVDSASPGSGTGRRSRRTVAVTFAVLASLAAIAVSGFTLLGDGGSGRPAGAPTPFASVPALCGLISPTQMNRLVPMAGVGGGVTRDAEDYFNEQAHPGTKSCQWNQRSILSKGYIAAASTRSAKAGPPDDGMKPARDDFVRVRRVATRAPLPEHYRSAPQPLPNVGDEAFIYDEYTGEAEFRRYEAIVVFRTRNLLTEVRYEWGDRGAPVPGGVGRLREGAAQISQWMAAALRAGRPLAVPPPARDQVVAGSFASVWKTPSFMM
jgi:hypothetical protein